ncbi:hypothetical protein TRICI_001256 [Trichomonascus ciferrii]|uniref:Aldehyde dehydrogenase domain-containing protein n=1 Tax=Trichomonascus ciferrii TaxID=44093 RepID=A0A642V919_9ASCO|nr:hypothetical protein TRICI_001256 [Trichomonascus ciferrii]
MAQLKSLPIKLDDPALVETSLNGCYVDGKFVTASGPTFNVVDPGSAEVWATMKSATKADVDVAVKSAEKAFQKYRRVPARERARLILTWDSLIRRNKEDIARVVVLETGKPYTEALGEVEYALTFSWWMAGEAERQHGSTIEGANPNNRFITTKQPVGVVAALTPWNFPVALVVRKAATALAAGCTVVSKPSPETPLSTLMIAQLATQAGFPAGCFNVLPCDAKHTPEIGKSLCEHSIVQKVSFTGSSPIGKLLSQQCANTTLKKVTLELGGNGPFIIFEDADLDRAVSALMQCKFRHAGQTCVCAQRVFVHKSISEKVTAELAKRISETLRLGHGFTEGVTLGPLTTSRSVEKAKKHVEDAVSKGAKLVLGGDRDTSAGNGYFFQPTLLTGMKDDMLISSEETFAPVLALYEFENEEEVLSRANDTDMGLTSYFFTQDADRIWRVFEAIETGNVGINTGMTTSAEAPFGGWHDSGLGKEAGMNYGISEYLKVKTATWNVNFSS